MSFLVFKNLTKLTNPLTDGDRDSKEVVEWEMKKQKKMILLILIRKKEQVITYVKHKTIFTKQKRCLLVRKCLS